MGNKPRTKEEWRRVAAWMHFVLHGGWRFPPPDEQCVECRWEQIKEEESDE